MKNVREMRGIVAGDTRILKSTYSESLVLPHQMHSPTFAIFPVEGNRSGRQIDKFSLEPVELGPYFCLGRRISQFVIAGDIWININHGSLLAIA